MTRSRRLLLLVTGLFALVPWLAPLDAAAQEEPLPLDPLAPVLAVLGPASSTVCGGVGVVGLLAPAALGPLAPALLPATGPVFTLCGVIPGTPASDRYACDLDQQSLSLIGTVTGLAGVPPALDIRPVAQLLETLGAALDLVLPPAQVDDVLGGPSIVLQCQHGPDADPELIVPTPPTTAPAEPAPAAPTDDAGPVAAPARPSAPAPVVAAPSSPVAPAPVASAPVAAPVVPAGALTPLGRVPFAYAAVFALPFLALLAGGAAGRDLLSPLLLDPEPDGGPT